MVSSWRRRELAFLILYAIGFYVFIIRRSLQLSHDYYTKLYGLRYGWINNRLNDVSDAQWRNFRENLPILTVVFGIFALIAFTLRTCYDLRARGMSIIWLLISLAYLSYLHGACIIFILLIASANFLLVKCHGEIIEVFLAGRDTFLMCFGFLTYHFLYVIVCMKGINSPVLGNTWRFWTNFGVLLDGISASTLFIVLAVVLRMISYGYDYHWTEQYNRFDQKKHIQRCEICSSGKTCYLLLQEKSVENDKISFAVYLCYLVYAPLYIAGPIISFNAFASQLEVPQKLYSIRDVAWYGLRWILSLFLMELMTHFFYYNAFAISGMWKHLSPMDNFIIGYGVLNFMWLKFFLLWRYFRFWSLVNGIETPENMPKCLNNCYNLGTFWKNWHASYNKWLVRYMYIPLGGAQRKLLNVWVVFTFVAIWHDLEWKLISWAWLTCIFFIPEMLVKSAANSFQGAFGECVFRELNAIAGAVTITCLMVANLVGFVIGPSGINWLISGFLQKQGLPTLGGMLFTFYIGTKLMFHISDAKQRGKK